jgi:serine/threonine protein kinase
VLIGTGWGACGVGQSEIRLLERLTHPNIVRYIASYQADNMLHIVLECVRPPRSPT